MPDTPTIGFRPMTAGDLSVAAHIGRQAMDALRRSQGEEIEPWLPQTPSSLAHILCTDPDGAWIGEVNGVAVGYAMSLVRGDIWFLSQLFVHPDQHNHGIGRELLRRSQEYGTTRGATTFSVIASTSPVAHALYMRAGMFATAVAYRMSGPLEPLLGLPEHAGAERFVDCSAWQDKIAGLDRDVFGAERREDHAFYLSGEGVPAEAASFGLSRDGELLGYAYATAGDGFIAPLAARAPGDQLPLLRMAAGWLLERGTATGAMLVISHNRVIMEALLAAGWQCQRWTFLLTSGPFGKFDRYHPAGGTLL